jgi:hypothetical protein
MAVRRLMWLGSSHYALFERSCKLRGERHQTEALVAPEDLIRTSPKFFCNVTKDH